MCKGPGLQRAPGAPTADSVELFVPSSPRCLLRLRAPWCKQGLIRRAFRGGANGGTIGYDVRVLSDELTSRVAAPMTGLGHGNPRKQLAYWLTHL